MGEKAIGKNIYREVEINRIWKENMQKRLNESQSGCRENLDEEQMYGDERKRKEKRKKQSEK